MGCKKGNIPWNKGLTKETDERVARNTRHVSSWSKKLWKERREFMLEQQRIGKEKSDNYPWNKGLTAEDERVARYVEASSRYMKERGLDPTNHWNFQGGKSQEEYGPDWTKELKERIRSRDGACMLCGILREKCKEWHNEDLIVHHIDGVKKNNSERNLVCLCRYCHASVHNTLVELPDFLGMWNAAEQMIL